jgi:predicted outer membrane repeat protein
MAPEGGGLWNDEILTLVDVVFRHNSATGAVGEGGGMYNLMSSPVLTGVIFDGNTAGDAGGGMFNRDGSPMLTDLVFRDNSATGQDSRGGGMYSARGGPTGTDVTFSGNSASNYGGGIYLTNSDATLTDVTFRENSVGNGGGGMYNYGSSLALTDVGFFGNSATAEDAKGGGLYNELGDQTLTNVAFHGNWSQWRGGGMYNDHSAPVLRNATIGGNWADAGGGMFNQDARGLILTNVTLNGNLARLGSAMSNVGSLLEMRNCILWGNRATMAGDQIENASSTPTIASSDIEGSRGSGADWNDRLGADLGGNVDADPWFRDPVDATESPTVGGDLHLRWGSAVIDAGNNDLLPPELTTDLDGNARIVNEMVDMGAYESQSRVALYLPTVLKAWGP